jgi:hypothetical protein
MIVGGWLPLHIACDNTAPLEVVQYLVKQWPEAVKTTNVDGKTPLGYAQNPDARFGRPIRKVIAWLQDVDAGRITFEIPSKQLPVSTPSKPEPEPKLEHDIAKQLQSACSEQPQQVDTIRFLVEACPEAVKVPNDNGSLPLHVACAYKAPLDVIQYLVEQWPEAIKTANHNGSLPLHHACKNKVPLDVVEFLVEEWPEAVKIMDSDGRTPLDCAKIPTADGGDPMSEVVSLLEAIQITDTKFKAEREEIRKAIALKRDEPVAVSQEYIEEILTNVQLGQGFFGVVWKGVDTVLNTAFAVKAIHQELVQHGYPADVQAARATLQRELDVRNATEIGWLSPANRRLF